jgi:hypothetical protein
MIQKNFQAKRILNESWTCVVHELCSNTKYLDFIEKLKPFNSNSRPIINLPEEKLMEKSVFQTGKWGDSKLMDQTCPYLIF